MAQAPPPPPHAALPSHFFKWQKANVTGSNMSSRAQLLRVAEFAMARGGARPAWYDGLRLVPPASFPTRTEAADAAGLPKTKALPKIVFEQDAFYARIRHKFPQLQKEPFSLAHRSRPMDIRSHAARVYASELQRLTSLNKRSSSSDIEAQQKSAFGTACAFIEQALAERLRTFHPLAANTAVSGGIPVHSIARAVQDEEEMYIAESQAFVEQQSRDAALAAQAEAAAKTLMLQQEAEAPAAPADFKISIASEPTKVAKKKGKAGAAAPQAQKALTRNQRNQAKAKK